jgi:hypothetical protein
MRLQAAQSALSALRLGLLVSSAPPQRAAIRLSDAFVDKLPAPNEVPPNGVEYTSRLSKEMTEHSWLLHWNHFINLQFFNDNVLSGIPGTMCPQIAYPVRMTESAGYRRVFNLRGGPERRMVGDQTILNLMRSEEDGASLVGSLVPVTSAALAALDTTFAGLHREVVHFEHFEWLAWMDPPADLTEVIVFRPGPMSQAAAGPPTFELPMVQSYVDDALKGALQYGDEFAAEVRERTRHHMMTPRWDARAVRPPASACVRRSCAHVAVARHDVWLEPLLAQRSSRVAPSVGAHAASAANRFAPRLPPACRLRTQHVRVASTRRRVPRAQSRTHAAGRHAAVARPAQSRRCTRRHFRFRFRCC